MPKRQRTPEERKAWGEKMKQARLAKQVLRENPPEMPANQDLGDILKELDELKKKLGELQNVTGTASQSPEMRGGRLTGVFEKYLMDPSYYPSPVERLSEESRLQQFAFKQRYFLKFEVSPMIPYERKDGILETQPKFTLELHARVVDKDTGELTDSAYVATRAIFFEDPQTAIIIAREQGLPVDNENEKAFLDEMRYIRMRDWLLECFYPPKPKPASNKQQTVIGNRLVEVYEISSEDSQRIPFESIKSKF